jgi:hypothetical protein
MTNEALQILNEWLNSAVTLAKDEIPLLAQEILLYSLFENIGYLLIDSILFFICYKLYKFVIQDCHPDDFRKDGNQSMAAMVLFFLGIITLCLFSVNLNNIIKIKLAPKIFLIDYCTDKIKS